MTATQALRIALLVLVGLILGSPVARTQPTAALRTGYVTVDSSRLYYEECGRGPAIVLIHDGLMGAASWDDVWPALCARAHVVRYDRRGVGRSTPPKTPFSQTADLEALTMDRGVTAATVVGSSAGGGLAIDFALEYPEQVQRLVLLGPVLNGMPYSEHFSRRERHNIEPLLHGDVQGAIENELKDPYALQPGNEAVRRKVRETLMANPQNLRNLLTINRFIERPAVPAAARLGELRLPILIMVGEHDIPDVHAHSGAIEFGTASARREIVPDGGHLIQLDHPEIVGPRILAFIAQTPVVTVPTQGLDAFAGTYTPVVGTQEAHFGVKDGRLMIHVDGARDTPLFAANDSTFYAVVSWGTFAVTFHRDPTAPGSEFWADVDVNGTTHRATLEHG